MGNWRLAMCVPDDSQIRKPADWQSTNRDELSTRNAEISRPTQGDRSHRAVDWFCGSHDHVGIADAIVDLVETGSTAGGEFGWRCLMSFGKYEAVLVQNKSDSAHRVGGPSRSPAGRIVIARSYSLLEYNVPESKLGEAEKVTPGFESPTISKAGRIGLVRRAERW